ncbi:unnamed protein product [Boreogadus saida]
MVQLVANSLEVFLRLQRRLVALSLEVFLKLQRMWTPAGARGAERLQDGGAILPSFMDSVILQEGAGGASGFVAVDYTL